MYIIFAIAILILLFFLSKGFSRLTARSKKYVATAGIILLSILLFRFGKPILGGLLAGAVTIPAIFAKAMQVLSVARFFKSLSGKKSPTSPNKSGTMSRHEAYEILGLNDGASKEEISTAYKKLMKNNHPDSGGSKYLAAKLNQAKDVLLKS